MSIVIPPFDYENAVETLSGRWQELGLHWHCYTWTGSGAEWADDQARQSRSARVTPSTVQDWLKKSPDLIKATPKTPEDAVAWLRETWGPVPLRQLYPQDIDWKWRYQSALHSLSHGTDVSWAQWVGGPSIVSVGVIGTSERCH